MEDDRYWPFDVLPPEKRSPLHQEQITFLEVAYREGFRPYLYGAESFAASADNRFAQIILRTHQFWELVITAPSEGRLCAYISGFSNNADAVLAFLRGDRILDVLNSARPFFIPAGGRSSGFQYEPPPAATT